MNWLLSWMGSPRIASIAVISGTLLGSAALGTGFVLDDYFHRAILLDVEIFDGVEHSPFELFSFVDGDPAHTMRYIDAGMYPWWTSLDVKLALWRPVTALTHMLDYALWPNSPFLMHLHNLAWFALLLVIVCILYRRMLGPGVAAGIAMMCYAIDDARAMPIGWIANRNSLIEAAFGFTAIYLHIRWREEKRTPFALAALAVFTIGLFAKEGTIAATAYLLGYALFLDRGVILRRLATLVPYAAVIVVWRIIYRVQGFGVEGSDTYTDPLIAPFEFTRQLFQRLPVLFASQWTGMPCDGFILFGSWWWILGATLIGSGVCVLLFPLLRRDATARFFCTGMVLSLVPVCAAFPMDRLLSFSGLGAMGLLAQFIVGVRSRTIWSLNGVPRRAASMAVVALVLIHVVVAPFMLVGRIAGFGIIGAVTDQIAEGMPFDESDANKVAVVLDCPTSFVTVYSSIQRRLGGMPTPRCMYNLAPDTFFDTEIRITRTDDKTLVYEPREPYRWLLFRDYGHPMAVGDTVELENLRVEVLGVSVRGEPTRVSFRFKNSIDDPGYLWLEFNNTLIPSKEMFVRIHPPGIGQSVVMNPGA